MFSIGQVMRQLPFEGLRQIAPFARALPARRSVEQRVQKTGDRPLIVADRRIAASEPRLCLLAATRYCQLGVLHQTALAFQGFEHNAPMWSQASRQSWSKLSP